MLKRGFDIVASGIALVALLPLMLVLAILVRLDSPGPSLFRQTRVGKSFCEFQLLKFRSMRNGNCGTEVTCGQDARITRVGAFLRAFKLDELPQLWNVFCGDMSLVGPRPEVPMFVARFRKDYEEILSVRPGITDPASIRYRSEAEILGSTLLHQCDSPRQNRNQPAVRTICKLREGRLPDFPDDRGPLPKIV
jgi:lipopolysaccharide/colanic/teichoic acid biosynthesis glycosyltransferase